MAASGRTKRLFERPSWVGSRRRFNSEATPLSWKLGKRLLARLFGRRGLNAGPYSWRLRAAAWRRRLVTGIRLRWLVPSIDLRAMPLVDRPPAILSVRGTTRWLVVAFHSITLS